MLVLPLAGAATVHCDGLRLELTGRASVFAAVTDFAYLPRDATVTVRGGGRFALPSARATRRLSPRYGAARDVPVELRGAGSASRQVNNFCAPEAFDCDRLVAVEVLTPGGNWSSYPPHKHEDDRVHDDGRVEAALEEIYYFEVSGAAPGDGGGPVGYQRVYGTDRRPIDVLAEVRSGDLVLVPYGYHGPSMATARLPPLLPQRAGRARSDPHHGLRGRSTARLDPGQLGRPAGRPAAAADRPTDGRQLMRRLTVAQALVAFLARQWSERDGRRRRLIPACFGIFGHGNVAGLGEALAGAAAAGVDLPYRLCRNEQAMVHTAAAYARMTDRLSTLACTTSIGPGATNMVTGAAARDDQPAAGAAAARRHLRHPTGQPGAAATGGRPLVRRQRQRRAAPGLAVLGPDQPAGAAAGRAAGRHAGAHRPGRDRRGHPRPAAGRAGRGVRLAGGAVRRPHLARAAPRARRGGRPAGRRDRHARPTGRCSWPAAASSTAARRTRCAASPSGTACRWWRPRPARAPCPTTIPLAAGAVGVTGTAAANDVAANADVVIGVGTRYSDFTTASGTLFAPTPGSSTSTSPASTPPSCRAVQVVGDARESLTALSAACGGWATLPAYRSTVADLGTRWAAVVDRARHADPQAPPTQAAVIGAVNDAAGPRRRGGLRGRLDARRPAQAVAQHRPEGLPRRVRLLLHGLRDRRRHRGQAGRAGPGGLRAGRRRFLSDAAERTGHRGGRGRQAGRGAGRQPGFRLDRPALCATSAGSTGSVSYFHGSMAGRSCAPARAIDAAASCPARVPHTRHSSSDVLARRFAP